MLKGTCERSGLKVDLAEDGESAMSMIKRSAGGFDVVVLDLVMPGVGGIAVLEWMAENAPDIPVIVQTGQGGIETVVRAMRAGAHDFAVKPVSPERLLLAIGNAVRSSGGAKGGDTERAGGKRVGGFDDIVVASPAMDRILGLARRAAVSDIPVVLEGESGVGKELIAKAIQSESARRTKPYVTVNCGAIPENLVESILFGHEKGAFTGAVDSHMGKFAEADQGTLFLDEIGDLPTDVQVKLLRAVQDGEIETIGSRTKRKVDIRLISATHKDLIEEVKAGRFREDLYYRLNVFPIHVPPLRQRKEDIPELARHFTRRFAEATGRSPTLTLTADAMALLTAHDWPGNIRELENAVHRAVVLSETDRLTADLFPQVSDSCTSYRVSELADRDRVSAGQAARSEASRNEAQAPALQPEDGWIGSAYPAREAGPHTRQDASAVSAGEHPAVRGSDMAGALAAISPTGDVRPLADVEEELIRFALHFYRGQMSEVARRLGIGRSTLYRKLKDYQIDPGDPLRVAA
nr:sigma-54 dependent transcriptional regulator [Pseudohoeflea sp. DP4N28-3]